MSKRGCIFQIDPHQVTPKFKSLFNPTDPTILRCFAVFDGKARGIIFTDSLDDPSWGLVQDAGSGRLYLGGEVHYPCLRRLVSRLRHHGKVLVGLWPDDQRWQLIPRAAHHSCSSLDFSDWHPEQISTAHSRIPDGFELHQMDLGLMEHCAGKDRYLTTFGSAHQALKNGIGLCLLYQKEVVCEAFAGPAAYGKIEVGTHTHVRHRHKGYATLTCHHLITQVEWQGYHTYASCDKENHASVALARKLGYRIEQEYQLLSWSKNVT